MTGNLPVHLERRTLPEQLRYLAGKLTDGTASPGVVALSLQIIADEHAEDGWDAARDRVTETNDARRGERERCAQLAEQEAASAERLREVQP